MSELKMKEAMESWLSKKKERLSNRGIHNPSCHVKFTKRYFPNLLNDIENEKEEYFTFIEKYIDMYPILIKFFKENKKIEKVAQELGITSRTVYNFLTDIKPKIQLKYNAYVASNYDISLISGNDTKLKTKYKNSKEYNYYESFTEFYIPEHKNELNNEKYLKFIDKIIDSDALLIKFFKEGKTLTLSSKELKVTNITSRKKLDDYKTKIKKLYEKYIDSNYSLEELNKKLNNDKNIIPYIKFAKYYLPEIVAEVEKRNEKYIEFIDIIFDKNIVLRKYFKENKNIATIQEELNLDEGQKVKGLRSWKNDILNLYYSYKFKVGSEVADAEDKHYREKSTLLENKGIENPKMYVKFTNFYLPELVDAIENQSVNYFKFIDKIISTHDVFIKYFKEGKNSYEISKEYGITSKNVDYILSSSKDKIVKIYNKYQDKIKKR